MEFESTLEQFQLSELIAMMAGSSVTGVLEVGMARPLGWLFCAEGRLYHAMTGNRVGIVALHAIVEAGATSFRFIAGPQCTVETLQQETESLIALVQRAERLHALMRRHIQDQTWVPELCSSNGASVRLHATLWPVLASIDGRRNVAQIAERLGHDPLEVGAVLSELIERGLVVITPPPRPAGAAGTPPATFFDRLMGGQLARKRVAQAAPASRPTLVNRLRLRAS